MQPSPALNKMNSYDARAEQKYAAGPGWAGHQGEQATGHSVPQGELYGPRQDDTQDSPSPKGRWERAEDAIERGQVRGEGERERIRGYDANLESLPFFLLPPSLRGNC